MGGGGKKTVDKPSLTLLPFLSTLIGFPAINLNRSFRLFLPSFFFRFVSFRFARSVSTKQTLLDARVSSVRLTASASDQSIKRTCLPIIIPFHYHSRVKIYDHASRTNSRWLINPEDIACCGGLLNFSIANFSFQWSLSAVSNNLSFGFESREILVRILFHLYCDLRKIAYFFDFSTFYFRECEITEDSRCFLVWARH